jgi:YHS domain-containing protein
MQGLIWFLAIGLFFYFMMRFGCGAHMVHGHGGAHRTRGEDDGGTDPVCGMRAAGDRGYTKVHAGARYWFCSKSCLEKFETEPEKYLVATAKGG